MPINHNPGMLLYPRIRKSPFFYSSREHGVALYSVYNRTYHPRHYGDPVGEYWALLNGVTLWDVGVEKQIEISGPDAFEFTNLLVTRDLSKCRVGQCKYVFLTNAEGGILNDPVLLRLEENRFWLSLADSDIELWAKGVAHGTDYDVTIEEIDVAPVQVQGPKSVSVMVDLFGEDILTIPYYYLRDYTIGGIDVVVSRTGYTSEIGYEVYVKNATKNAPAVWNMILEAGEPHGLKVIGPCHIRRIEGGFLAHGSDITFDTNPFEIGMGYDWMVNFEGGDFIGREALAKVKAEGATRGLAGIEISGPPLGSYNDGSMIDSFAVYDGEEAIGYVPSACFSPRLEKNIGYAMVPTAYLELGTTLTIDTGSDKVEATVVPKPFVDPEKDEPKSDVSGLVNA